MEKEQEKAPPAKAPRKTKAAVKSFEPPPKDSPILNPNNTRNNEPVPGPSSSTPKTSTPIVDGSPEQYQLLGKFISALEAKGLPKPMRKQEK